MQSALTRMQTKGQSKQGGVKRTILAAAIMVLSISTLTAAPIAEVSLPNFARTITTTDGGLVVATLVLQGTAMLRVDGDEIRTLAVLPNLPALHATQLDDERFLVAERFGHIAILKVAADDSVTETHRWKMEADPVAAYSQADGLYIASGAAGLYRYDWEDQTAKPMLRARYPFVDYSKEIAFGDEKLLYLADNFDTGLQILEIVDPERIRVIDKLQGDFIDSVARHENVIAVAYRRNGVGLFHIADPRKPERQAFIPVSATERALVNQLRFAPDGRLIICEGRGGARIVTVTDQGTNLTVTQPGRTYGSDTGGVSSGAFLADGRVLLSGNDGTIRLYPKEQ